jgi:hypothetical protein
VARPKIQWTDAQLRDIMSMLASIDRKFPVDNARFLDQLIDAVRAITGRLDGATTYSLLLRDVATGLGIERHPSSTTIQKAVSRAQSLAPAEADELTSSDMAAWRRALIPVVRDALGPLHALLAEQHTAPARSTTEVKGDTVELIQRLQMAELVLHDAHARVRRLEDENGRLRREAAQAEARASSAESRITQLFEELLRKFSESASGADFLGKIAKRLDGTEQFLKMQNDAVRLQVTAEADTLRRQVKQLREQIDHLQIDNDQFRRALTKQKE